MTETEQGLRTTFLRVGDNTYSKGDVNGTDWKVICDTLLARIDAGFATVEIGPGVYSTPTGVPTWTRGATAFRVSKAAIFIPAASTPAANSDALIMHVAQGTNDVTWDGGQMLAPIGALASAGERVGIRMDCSNSKVTNFTIRMDSSPVAISTLNYESFFAIAFGPAYETATDLLDVIGKNNCEIAKCTFYGEVDIADYGGRVGLVRSRKVAQMRVIDNDFGGSWSEQVAGSAMTRNSLYGYLLEDCFAPRCVGNLFAPGVYAECLAREVVTERHLDFAQIFVEGDHGETQLFAHGNRCQNGFVDLRTGGFGVVDQTTRMGAMICPSHSIPLIWIRPGTNTSRAFDAPAGNVPVGTSIRIQDGAGGDVTYACVASGATGNQFNVGASTSLTIDALKAKVNASFLAGALRASVRNVDLGAGARRALISFIGKVGRAPATPTVTITAGGAGCAIVTTTSRPHRPVDYDVHGSYHWASDDAGSFNHPVLVVDKAMGTVDVSVKIGHVRPHDPGWSAAVKRANNPLVFIDCTFVGVDGCSARPFVASTYNSSGVFEDNIESFPVGDEPSLCTFIRTEGRVGKYVVGNNRCFNNFAGTWTSDGTVTGTDVEEFHNYVNGVVSAST